MCVAARSCEGLFFDEAGSLRPLSPGVDEFAVLGVPLKVNVDKKELEDKMRNLQRRLHPDKFAGASQDEKAMAEAASAKVNAAFQTLSDPLARADRAVALCLGKKEILSEDSKEVDADVLMYAMETREAVEDASTIDQLKELYHDTESQIKTSIDHIASLHDSEQCEAAAHQIVRLRYLTTIQTEIRKAAQDRFQCYSNTLQC